LERVAYRADQSHYVFDVVLLDAMLIHRVPINLLGDVEN
jgi:hypothetical protein